MGWRIRDYKHDSYKDFVLFPGESVLNMNDVDLAFHHGMGNVVHDNRPGAVPTYCDLYKEDWGWLYDECERLVRKANTSAWKFRLTGWNQPLRLNLYREGDQFVAHSDYYSGDRSKVAFVSPITQPAKGGDQFLLDVNVPRLGIGDFLVFPAFHPNGVSKVTEGTRVYLSGWATGPRFN